MSVFELLAPRKNWTDLVVKSVDSTTIQTGQIAIVQTLNLGSVTGAVAPGPITLDATQIISGLFYVTGIAGGTIIINMPTAIEISSQFNTTIPAFFFFYIYNYSTSSLSFQLGTGCHNLSGPSQFTVGPNSNSITTFYGGGSSFTVFS